MTLAEIVRPQGRKGELLAEIRTDFPERFAERRRGFLRPGTAPPHGSAREVTLEHHWLHGGRVVLKFAGVDSIEEAERLRGLAVALPRAERAPLEEGAVYIGDLLGCTLHDRTTGGPVGVIVDVDRSSSSVALIVVQPPGRRAEVLVPFANAYEPRIDLEERRMEMTLPEGLLTLDAPWADDEEVRRSEGSGGLATPGAANAGRRSPKRRKRA